MGKRGQVLVSANAVGDFAALARDLRRAGATELRKELYAGLQRSARPAIRAAQESAETTLPSGRGAYKGGGGKRRGRKRVGRRSAREGLNALVANAGFKPRYGQRKDAAKLTITASEKRGAPVDLAALDRGRLRHPLFANRGHWYTQAVPSGWFTRPMQAQAGAVGKELERAVDRVTQQINRG